MTAPRKLPPCPVCGRQPSEWACFDVAAWGILCSGGGDRADNDEHEIYVIKPTKRRARAVWRRLVGGAR